MNNIRKSDSGRNIPEITKKEADARHLLSRATLNQMHLVPTGNPVAFERHPDSSITYFFDPGRVKEAPPEQWYAPTARNMPMTLDTGSVIERMSVKRAAAQGYYPKERLEQKHYIVVEEPVAYTVRNDKSILYFYDIRTASKMPMPCAKCGKNERYRHKLCRECFEKDLAARRAVGDAYRNQHFGMKRERVLFFDLELTDVYVHDEIISISICDGNGTVLMDTLVRPLRKKKWKRTERIHGITPEMVANAPLLADLIPTLKELFANADELIAFGVSTDYSHIKFIYDTEKERDRLKDKTRDCAKEFVRYAHEHDPDQVHMSLIDAMECFGVSWGEGVPHTSIADTIACQKVWDCLFPHYYEE